MFALAEIVKDKLYALREADGDDVFQQCFENWQDVAYLYSLFKANPEALAFYGVDIKTAISQICKESEQFSEDILNIAEGSSDDRSLDHIVFQPLHARDDFDLPIIETKAYGKELGKSFLRLYAIRLKDGTYIVVGGLIKTTQSLQDCEEGRQLMQKLKTVSEYLRKGNMYDSFDIGILII